MNAAIYARKSTEQRGVSDDAKSVARQIEHARAFALTRGWNISDGHVYADDGISGAEFEKRPGLQRLLHDALGRRSPFGVVIVAEQKAIGREVSETSFTIKRLAEAGVEIIEYVHGRSLTPKNWIDKLTGTVLASIDEGHRQQTRERVHESHSSKHARGHVVGGRVFGYRNVDVTKGVDQHGRPLRSHVERVVVPAEAAVVRQIFQLYADGLGLKAIAKRLMQEGAIGPKPFVRKDPTKVEPVQGWAPSTIRAILDRTDYVGVYRWNRSIKRTEWGKTQQKARPASEWQSTTIPAWRIVSDKLWHRVRERRKETEGRTLRFTDGRMSGRPPAHGVNNLLAGLATCGLCGGGLVVETSKGSPRKPRTSHYVCHRRRAFGGCTNTLRIPVDALNEAVLQAIEQHALTPEAVEAVIALTERDDRRDQEAALIRERTDVDKRIANLVAAIEAGGDAPSLVAKVRALEARRGAIADELAGLRPVPRLPAAIVRDRLDEWRRLIRASVTQGRAVIQRIVVGRIRFTPRAANGFEMDGGYDFEAQTRFDKLFAGVAAPQLADGRDLTGTEGITAADTWDADYARLLERAQKRLENRDVERVASPPGFEPGFQP
jgi:site-specific DNA recombinase